MVLIAPTKGVLCWMDNTEKVGTTTVSGHPPLVIPYLFPPSLSIATPAIDPMLLAPDRNSASTLTAGDD